MRPLFDLDKRITFRIYDIPERGGSKISAESCMRTSILICFISLFGQDCAAQAEISPSMTVSNGHVYVTTASGKKQTLAIRSGQDDADAKFIDLSFTGHADLVILRDQGANQRFYDVYLYSEKMDQFLYNDELSNVPCLTTDIARKQLVGQCFHESACENWKEYYSISPGGNIALVEREGTYCDPVDGQAFTYLDRFLNGRKISSKISPLKNHSDD